MSSHVALIRVSVAATCLLISVPRSASAALVWDNGVSGEINGTNISDFALADDFVLAAPAAIDQIRLWAFALGEDLATSASFNGAIGWAIHADNSGIPGAVLFSGLDASPTLTPDGLNVSDPEYILDLDLVPAVNLGAGTYWLQLREGAVGSAFDGSSIFWSDSVSLQGSSHVIDSNEASPGEWSTFEQVDSAFQLFGPGPAAIAVPEPSTIALLGLAIAGLAAKCRRAAR